MVERLFVGVTSALPGHLGIHSCSESQNDGMGIDHIFSAGGQNINNLQTN